MQPCAILAGNGRASYRLSEGSDEPSPRAHISVGEGRGRQSTASAQRVLKSSYLAPAARAIKVADSLGSVARSGQSCDGFQWQVPSVTAFTACGCRSSHQERPTSRDRKRLLGHRPADRSVASVSPDLNPTG